MTFTSSAAVLNYSSDSREGDDYKQSAVKPEGDTVRRCRPNDFMMATLFGTSTYGKETFTLQRSATNKCTADVNNRINHKKCPSVCQNESTFIRAVSSSSLKRKGAPELVMATCQLSYDVNGIGRNFENVFCTDENQI